MMWWRGGHLSGPRSLSAARAARWAAVLRAWDAHCAGASQRDIAYLLWGRSRGLEEWNGRSDYLRMRVYRMIHSARRLVDGDWWALLRSEKGQPGVSPATGRPRHTPIGSFCHQVLRADERLVGKAGVSPCRPGGAPSDKK